MTVAFVVVAATAFGASRLAGPRIIGPRATAPGPATFTFRAPRMKKPRFRCSLDAPRLHGCPSTYKVVLAEGTHALRAQALAKGRRPSAVTKIQVVAKTPLPSAGTVAARISVFNPNDVAFAAGRLWVALHHSGAVAAIDPATNAVATSVPVTSNADEQPGRFAYGGGALWLTNYTNEGIPGSLVRIDPVAQRVVAVVRSPAELCCTPIVGGGWVWAIAPDLAGGSLVKVSEQTNGVAGTMQVAGAFSGAYGAGSVWVGSGSDVVRIDPATNAITARIPMSGDAFVVGFGAGTVWVDLGTTIARIDPSTNSIVGRIELPEILHGEVHAMAIDGDRAWFTGSSAAKPALWRVDVSTNTVTGVVLLGASGGDVGGVAVGAGAVWASLFDRNTVVRVAPS